jgi:hypothetical protein
MTITLTPPVKLTVADMKVILIQKLQILGGPHDRPLDFHPLAIGS